jgi:hypothetical protein
VPCFTVFGFPDIYSESGNTVNTPVRSYETAAVDESRKLRRMRCTEAFRELEGAIAKGNCFLYYH